MTGANGRNVEQNWPILCRVLNLWGIDSPAECVGVIGTIAVETGSFAPLREAYWLSEAARNAEYAKRGYGIWHGRGFVQLTWESNYQQERRNIRDKTGLDFPIDETPDLALDPEVAAHCLASYFVRRGVAEAARSLDWAAVRVRVYGGQDAPGTAKIRFAAERLLPLARDRGFL